MSEDEYIIATTLARVYALRELLHHIMADDRWVTEAERKTIHSITLKWEGQLQKHCTAAMDRE